jgi:hypothetical protein
MEIIKKSQASTESRKQDYEKIILALALRLML